MKKRGVRKKSIPKKDKKPDKKKKLIMTFDPLLIDDLGAKLYSTLPPIISELIANGYDACARKVWIELKGKGGNKTIIIRDNGIGMNFYEVEAKYLKIGRKRRDKKEKNKCKRPPIGKKGIGKLAFFGIANKAIIETVQDYHKVKFEMNWKKIQNLHEGEHYEPVFSERKTKEKHGTKVTLTGIYRKTEFSKDYAESLKKSISNYIIFDKDFKVFIKTEKDKKFVEIKNELRYKFKDRKEAFSWNFPAQVNRLKLKKRFPFARNIKGKIILLNKPVPNTPHKLRGVTLFSRRKLVSLPELFPEQGSSHFFQYLTGWLEVDFIDEFRPDVIATNRSTLNWNDPQLNGLRQFLKEIVSFIHKDWRKKMRKKTEKDVFEKFKINISLWKKSNKENKLIKENIKKFIKILKDPEKIEKNELMDVLEIIHSLAPDYADFVLWRNLNKKIKDNPTIKRNFSEKRYLEAAREAVQIYNEEVQKVSRIKRIDYNDLVAHVFGKEKSKIIWVTNKSNTSKQNIDEGQKFLSMGLMIGFKNPGVSHTSVTKGLKIKDFTDRNCLDILSTLSYLLDRLENRKRPPKKSKK